VDWLTRLLRLDRRIIFLLVAVGVIVPLLVPVNLPVTPTPRVLAAYETIRALPAGSRVLVSMDFEPDIMAELEPMAIGVLRQCFRQDLRVTVMTLYPAGVGLAEQAIRIAATAEGAKRYEDYVFLGYKSGFQTVILGIGESLRSQYPVDFYGTPIDSIPMLQDVRNYGQFQLVINLSGSAAADYWIQLARTRYHAPLVLGCTAVMATDYYPYLSSGQLLGLIGGMKGAAEYEMILGIVGDGRRGMDAQSVVHVIIVVLVIAGNVAMVTARRRGDAGAGPGASGAGSSAAGSPGAGGAS
jgi:hypothetical protein